MSHVYPYLNNDGTSVHDAMPYDVKTVLGGERSQWVWVRLSNGDLVLGVFPQGETYEKIEQSAVYPL